jgi:hypothetical protein
MNFLLRLLLVIAGLILATSLIVVMVILLLVGSVRAFWRKLTGQPVMPFAMRMNPRAGFERVLRPGQQSESERAKPRRHQDNVTDVEPKR